MDTPYTPKDEDIYEQRGDDAGFLASHTPPGEDAGEWQDASKRQDISAAFPTSPYPAPPDESASERRDAY